jgi:hypothetical protein
VTEASDENGRSLVAAPPGQRFFYLNDGINPTSLPLSLKAPDHRGGTLRLLKGFLPVEVIARPRELVTVPDVNKAQGKSYRGGEGHQLHIESVRSANSFWNLDVRLSGPPGWQYDPNTYGLELIDAHDRVIRFRYAQFQPFQRQRPQPEDLAWLTAAPLAPSLLQVPWTALAQLRVGGQRMEWRGWVQQYSRQKLDAPVRLRLYRFERLKGELPFEFHDLPLP